LVRIGGILNQETIDLITLNRLMRSDHLEKFLGSKFPSAKRFGIEGCESLIPGLWAIVEAAVPLGLEGIEMGMAHRCVGAINRVAKSYYVLIFYLFA